MNVKIKFWEMTLKAQWQARRDLQKNKWQLKESDPQLVKDVANGLVSFAIRQLRKTKKEINNS